IIVGNLYVGGTGKTPTVIWLADALRSDGFSPGIVSRGYLGRKSNQEVLTDSDPRDVGDEAVLIKRRTQCPTWVSPNRPEACARLLKAHPGIDVIISDDGLQHYQLQRDFEIAVIDSERAFGNKLLLPSGPLREPISRLKKSDLAIINGIGNIALSEELQIPTFDMRLIGDRFRSLGSRDSVRSASEFEGKNITAIAGIGNPNRFFDSLEKLGLSFQQRSLPDHYPLSEGFIRSIKSEIILMTEKDAVKLSGIQDARCWYLPVTATLAPGCFENIKKTIEKNYGRKTS
ncbi:MAG: tetraacyldisaccharide 4'-kinase, partial [Burkholderiales bacterium]